MGIKDKAKKAATGAGVVIAAAGCSSGCHIGGVDPAPEPLECTEVDEGETLEATAVLSGMTLTVTIENNDWRGTWAPEVIIDQIQGATLTEASRVATNRAQVVLELESDTTTSGSFYLQGSLVDDYNDQCAVRRTFTFSITGEQVEVALGARALPLSGQHRAEIALTRLKGREVELEARTGSESPERFEWTVTGGELLSQLDNRVRWRLPESEGFYQAQVVVDFGDSGIAFDAVNLERRGKA